VLVWRNATRVRLIQAFRNAYGAPEDQLLPGEPLICDGIELPLKHRKKRIDLEARGLIKGAQVIYLGEGNRPALRGCMWWGRRSRSFGGLDHQDREAGRGGALHPLCRADGGGLPAWRGGDDPQGARQQWEEVQVFAPDLYAAAQSGRSEAGCPCGSGWPMSRSPGRSTGCTGWCGTGWRGQREP
jgi:exodeoxyribonuclease-5